MNTLNLENITNQAPYQITLVEEEPCIFYFQTDYEVEYEIVIKSNDLFIPSGAYALDIINIWGNCDRSKRGMSSCIRIKR